jgi:hypothetical protein
VRIGQQFAIDLCFNIRKKRKKRNGVKTGIGQISDIFSKVVKLWI